MILQYTIIKPILAIIYIITEEMEVLHEGSFSPKYAYLYLVMIENVSVTLALWYLVLFYMVTHEPLESFRPVAKFLCVKMVIFFTFWQGIVISLLVYFGVISEHNWGREGYFSTALNDWLICFEMFFFSLAFGYAFGAKTYRDMPESAKKQVLHQIASILNPKKFKSDLTDFRRILSNFRDVLSQRDMIDETVEAFGKKGRRWLKSLEEWLDLPLYQKRQRILKEGVLRKRAAHFARYKERYFLLLDSPRGLVYFDSNPFPSADSSQALLSAGSGPSGGSILKEKEEGDLLEVTEVTEGEAKTNDLLHPPLEFISMSEITSVEQDEVMDRHGWHFTINTSSRQWVLCSQTHPEMEAWISSIQRLAEAENIQNATEEVGAEV